MNLMDLQINNNYLYILDSDMGVNVVSLAINNEILSIS